MLRRCCSVSIRPVRLHFSTQTLNDASKNGEQKQSDQQQQQQQNNEQKEKQSRFLRTDVFCHHSSKPILRFKGESWTKFIGTVGSAFNWTIPLAAITHILSSEDPTVTVDPKMTAILAVYSMIFTRWSLAVTPPNYPNFIWSVCCRISIESTHHRSIQPYNQRCDAVCSSGKVFMERLGQKRPAAPRFQI